MNDFLKMDIFFVVTTILVLVVGVVMFLIALRIWHILGSIERIAKIAETESELIREDIAILRADIRREGFKISSLFRLFKSMFTKHSSK